MSYLEWTILIIVGIAQIAVSGNFWYRALQYQRVAKQWCEKAEAKENAIKEAILLINYGARDEAIELLGKHGIVASVRDRT